MFDYFKKKAIENRASDEILYEYVTEELEKNIKVKGLWAKAYANSDGNDNKIEPLYMQYRVQSIKDVFSSLEIMYNELSRQKLFDFISNGFKDKNIESKIIKNNLPTKSKTWKMILQDGYSEYGSTTLRDKNSDIFTYYIENNQYIISKDNKKIKSYHFK